MMTGLSRSFPYGVDLRNVHWAKGIMQLIKDELFGLNFLDDDAHFFATSHFLGLHLPFAMHFQRRLGWLVSLLGFGHLGRRDGCTTAYLL